MRTHGFLLFCLSFIIIAGAGTAQTFFRSSLNPPQGKIHDIYKVNSDILYAGGEFGTLLKTTDGGHSWEVVTTNFSYRISDIQFTDELTGFIAVENSTVFFTTNGGITWRLSYLPVGGVRISKILPFRDALLLTGSDGRIFRSTDNGENWNFFSWPVENPIEDFIVIGNSLCIITTMSGDLYTSDDGHGWFLKVNDAGVSLNSLQYIELGIILAGGGSGIVFRSTDFGESWISTATGSINAILKLAFYTATDGFAVSDSGEVYHTSDKGLSWQLFNLSDGFRAASITPYNSGKIFIGGFSGEIATLTLPSGWQVYAGLPKYNIYSVSTTGVFGMYAASDSGRIYYSLYGSVWSLYKTPLRVALRSIHAAGDTMAWAAGDSGYVCHKVASTGIWETYHTGFNTQLTSIFGITAQHAVSVGKSGLIVLSTDGGQSWTQIPSPISVNLNSVIFLNKTIGIIVGDAGTILRSSDAGFSWNIIESGVTANLRSLASDAYPWAVAAGDSGTYLTTNTHGQTWVIKNLNVDYNFNAACFGNQLNVFLLTGRGNIYKAGFLAPTISTVYENTDSIYFSSISAKGMGSITIGAYNDIAFRHYTNLQIPVELTSFTAQNADGKILLSWNTATETNNRGFEIQKSFNNKDWLDIGFISGSGTSTEPAAYSFTDNYPSRGTLYYRLRQIDYDGRAEILQQIEVPFETAYELEQNYPNPFNPVTEISYSIPYTGKVALIVYDALGREVAVLVNREQTPGRYTVSFDASAFASGIYFYKLQTGNFRAVQKMVLLR